MKHLPVTLLVCLAVWLSACVSKPQADLAAIYDVPAQNIGSQRNPVIVIPGILGSKLEDPMVQTPVWGAFTYGAADPDYPDGARLVALLVRGLEIDAYDEIIRTLAAGAYYARTRLDSSPASCA